MCYEGNNVTLGQHRHEKSFLQVLFMNQSVNDSVQNLAPKPRDSNPSARSLPSG